ANLLSSWAFDEAKDASVVRAFHNSIGSRVGHTTDTDCNLSLFLTMTIEKFLEFSFSQDVSIDDNCRVVDQMLHSLESTSGSHRGALNNIAQGDSEIRSVTKDITNPSRLEVEAQNDLCNSCLF